MPGQNQSFGLTGVAATDLGFGGEVLGNQVKDETEEQRRKRLAAMLQPGAQGAVAQLFGTTPGGRGGAAGYGA